MTISVVGPEEELFIRKERTVKSDRINLFRESIFISCLTKHLSFNIYEVEGPGNKKLLISLTVPQEEFSLISQKPIMFKTEKQGFLLTWDSWLFSEEDEPDTETDRDYSELNIPFENL